MFKYIIVPATGEETDIAAFATALSVARLSAAHLVFLHARLDIDQTLLSLTKSGDVGGFGTYGVSEALERKASELRRNAEASFRAFCDQEKLATSTVMVAGCPSAEFIAETGDEERILVEYGRAADLLVIGQNAAGVKEAVLMNTGRPVLMAPAKRQSWTPRTVAIAWKDSAEAARAVAAARPIIEIAEHVEIVTVEEGVQAGDRSSEKLEAALAWHNRSIGVRRLLQEDRSPAETLLAALEGRADLLVMGGYGHSRVREVIFGGFTQRVLKGIGLPVLMTH